MSNSFCTGKPPAWPQRDFLEREMQASVEVCLAAVQRDVLQGEGWKEAKGVLESFNCWGTMLRQGTWKYQKVMSLQTMTLPYAGQRLDNTRDPRRSGRLLWDQRGTASDLARTILMLGITVGLKPLGPSLTQILADCAWASGLMDGADGKLLASMMRLSRMRGMPINGRDWLPLARDAKVGAGEDGAVICPWMSRLLAKVMKE